MNISNENQCAWKEAGNIARYIFTYVEMPITFFLGLIGQLLALVTFFKQAKKEKAYYYQIIQTLNDMILIFCRSWFVVTYYWLSGYQSQNGGTKWFRSCYVCMWITTHFPVPIENMFITSSVLLAVAMASDRVFALGKPFVYKNINHKRHQIVACSICILLGVFSSAFYIIAWYPELGVDGLHSLKYDNAYAESPFAVISVHLRNGIRGIGAIALLILDASMIILYRRHLSKVGNMTNSNEAKRRREQQKILTALSITESIGHLTSMSFFVLYYAMLYITPSFRECESLLIGPLTDMTQGISALADTYLPFIVSKAFRKMVFESIPALQRFSTTN